MAGVTFDQVREIALALPGVTESSLHGRTALKVSGRLLASPAIHASAEPNSAVVAIDPRERKALLGANPGAFYLTDHYEAHPVILVRLDKVRPGPLERLLGAAWDHGQARAGKKSKK